MAQRVLAIGDSLEEAVGDQLGEAAGQQIAGDAEVDGFAGDTGLSATFTGRDRFRAWLEGVFERFDDLRFTVLDVAVKGWPWHTRVAVRLRITATLADGSPYDNVACQWITLRWGKMTDDWVLEDTARLENALAVQERAPASNA